MRHSVFNSIHRPVVRGAQVLMLVMLCGVLSVNAQPEVRQPTRYPSAPPAASSGTTQQPMVASQQPAFIAKQPQMSLIGGPFGPALTQLNCAVLNGQSGNAAVFGCVRWSSLFLCNVLAAEGAVGGCQKIGQLPMPPQQAAMANYGLTQQQLNDPNPCDPFSRLFDSLACGNSSPGGLQGAAQSLQQQDNLNNMGVGLACEPHLADPNNVLSGMVVNQTGCTAARNGQALLDRKVQLFNQRVAAEQPQEANCVLADPAHPQAPGMPPLQTRRDCAGLVLANLYCKVQSLSADPKSGDLATCIEPGASVCTALQKNGLVKKCQ